jgi:predicted metal-dependent peptidase
MKREVVEGVMQTLKSRGLSSGEVETILNKLRKTRKDYLKEIKRTMSSHVFGTKKQKTIVRPNRRGIVGLKGHKKYRTEINVILDTSGSMGGEFEKVLSYVFQNDIEINLIQIDARVQDVIKIKDKKQLEKMRIRGLGGTTLQPGIDFMSNPKNKIHRNNTVILTDGWTDNLNFKEVKTQTLILSTASKCPIDWDNGKVKQILDVGKQE